MSEISSDRERLVEVLLIDLEHKQNALDEAHSRALAFELEIDRLKAELHKLRDEGLTW